MCDAFQHPKPKDGGVNGLFLRSYIGIFMVMLEITQVAQW